MSIFLKIKSIDLEGLRDDLKIRMDYEPAEVIDPQSTPGAVSRRHVDESRRCRERDFRGLFVCRERNVRPSRIDGYAGRAPFSRRKRDCENKRRGCGVLRKGYAYREKILWVR